MRNGQILCGLRGTEFQSCESCKSCRKRPPGFARSAGPTERRKFSNDWKNFSPFFQRLEKNVSNGWKTFPAEEFLDRIYRMDRISEGGSRYESNNDSENKDALAVISSRLLILFF